MGCNPNWSDIIQALTATLQISHRRLVKKRALFPCIKTIDSTLENPVGARLHHTAMTLAILFSLKTMESLQNGVASHFGVTALFSIKPVLLALSHYWPSIDAEAQCEWALTTSTHSQWTISFHFVWTRKHSVLKWLFDAIVIYKLQTNRNQTSPSPLPRFFQKVAALTKFCCGSWPSGNETCEFRDFP